MSDSGGLLAARALPDGSYEFTDSRDATDRLRNGDPTLGWSGDPDLSLVLNVKAQEWEVWRVGATGREMHCPVKPGAGVPIQSLIREIVKHDTRHVDVLRLVEDTNAQVDRDRDAAFREKTGEAGYKLAHALSKDLGLPAPDGKVFPLSGRR